MPDLCTNRPDDALTMSMSKQTDGAFTAFVTEHGRGWERLAFLLVGDGDRSRDLLQGVLLKVFRHWRRIGSLEHRDAYVRRMITTGFLDARRRRSAAEIPTDVAALARDRHGATDPADQVSDRDLLRRALQELTPAQRAVVVLRYVEELDDDSIAEHLHCSPATVRSHAAQGRARMRANLTGNTFQGDHA